MKLLLLGLLLLNPLANAGALGTTDAGYSIQIETICIEGIQYYRDKDSSGWKHYAKGYGYMAVAIDRKTMKPKLCEHKKPVAKK